MIVQDQKYIAIRILINQEISGLLSNFLVEEGSGGVVLEDNQNKENVWLVAYFPEEQGKGKLQSIHNYLGKLKELGLKVGEAKVQSKEMKQKDWARGWRNGFKGVAITERVFIQPPWEKEKLSGKITIKIDPQMAFGTGQYPTTKLCMKSLEEFIKPNGRVLDVGTGSGILAIAAVKLGASYVLALDVDPLALENAKENIRLNRVQKEVELKSGTVDDSFTKKSFDIVLANLEKGAILRLFEQMRKVAKRGAFFILSGISKEEKEEVEDYLTRKDLKLVSSTGDKEWTCIVAQGGTSDN